MDRWNGRICPADDPYSDRRDRPLRAKAPGL